MSYQDSADLYMLRRPLGKPVVGIPASAIAAWVWSKPWHRDNSTLLDRVRLTGSVRTRQPGRCLDLTKTSNQYVSFNGDYLSRLAQYSVVIYFNVEDNGISGIYPLWESTTSSSNRNGASISASTGAVSFGYYNGSSYTGLTSTQSGYGDGNWHCAVFINDAGSLSMYIDGVNVGASGTMGNLSSVQAHTIGYFSNGSHYMNGKLSHYFGYNRLLTFNEVLLFNEMILRPWVLQSIPTDSIAWYYPLEGEETDLTFNAAKAIPTNGIITNYASGMILERKDVPFSYENLTGYAQSYKYNGSDNYHTSTLNGDDLPSTGSAEFIFTMHTATISTGYYCGFQNSNANRFYFGVNGTGAGSGASKLSIAFQNMTAGSIAQGSSSVTALVGKTYGLKATWDGADVSFAIDQGNGYSTYRTVAYSTGFASRDFIFGAIDNNGSISNYAPFIVHRLIIRDGSDNITYDSHVDGMGSVTNTPALVKIPTLLSDDTIGASNALLEHSGIVPWDIEISGWDGEDLILIDGQVINFNTEPEDPVCEFLNIPTGYEIDGESGDLIIGRNISSRETNFYIKAPRLLTTFCVGNSLTQDFSPHFVSERVFHHIASNTDLTTIVASPTTNLTGDSHRWDLAFEYSGVEYDVITIQPFTADTPYSATDGNSPTYGGEMDAAQTLINSGTDNAVIILYTGFNRQADHATDYAYTGTFEDSDPMVYCPDFFTQFYEELQTNNPDRDIRFANMLEAMEIIYQDIQSGSGFYSAWGDIYRDGIHLEYTPTYSHNLRRLANSVIRKTIGYQPLDNTYFPYLDMSGDEVDYQNTVLDELFNGV